MKTRSELLRRLGAGALLTAVLLGGFAVHLRVGRRAALVEIAEHRARLADERLAADGSRDALWGETADGPAWPHYAAALASVDTWGPGQRDLVQRVLAAVATGDGVDPAEQVRLVTEYADALEALRRGAHARDATMEIDWDAGFSARIPKLVDGRNLECIAVCVLLSASDEEEFLDGARAVLDAQQFGRDLMVSDVMICEAIGASLVVPGALLDHLAEGFADRMPRAAKEAWLDGLRRLEASVPAESVSLRGELELVAAAFTRPAPLQLATGETGPIAFARRAWNGLFTVQHVAEHLDSMGPVRAGYEAAFALPAAEVLPAITALVDEAEARANPVSAVLLPRLDSMACSRAWSRARLSFLRHALELHLGVAGAPPLDPFGAGVEVEREGGRVRIRTAAPRERSGGQVLEVVF